MPRFVEDMNRADVIVELAQYAKDNGLAFDIELQHPMKATFRLPDQETAWIEVDVLYGGAELLGRMRHRIGARGESVEEALHDYAVAWRKLVHHVEVLEESFAPSVPF